MIHLRWATLNVRGPTIIDTGGNHMKSKRHTPEQVITKLAEGDKMLNEGKTIAEVPRSFGITETTWYRCQEYVWRDEGS